MGLNLFCLFIYCLFLWLSWFDYFHLLCCMFIVVCCGGLRACVCLLDFVILVLVVCSMCYFSLLYDGFVPLYLLDAVPVYYTFVSCGV